MDSHDFLHLIWPSAKQGNPVHHYVGFVTNLMYNVCSMHVKTLKLRTCTFRGMIFENKRGPSRFAIYSASVLFVSLIMHTILLFNYNLIQATLVGLALIITGAWALVRYCTHCISILLYSAFLFYSRSSAQCSFSSQLKPAYL